MKLEYAYSASGKLVGAEEVYGYHCARRLRREYVAVEVDR